MHEIVSGQALDGDQGKHVAFRIPLTALEIRHSIETSIHSRSASPGTRARRIEEALKIRLARVWKATTKRPSLGVIAATGVGLAAAELIGVGEILVGIAFGYAAYLVLHKHMPFDKAVEEAERLIKIG